MVTVRYRGYWVFILLARDDSRSAMLSPIVRISLRKEANPMATLYTGEVFFAEDDALVRRFELAMQWIDETLPQLTLQPTQSSSTYLPQSAMLID